MSNDQYREWSECPFKMGDTLIFEPKNFNPDFWNNLSEEDRIKYYGDLGYGKDEIYLFCFMTEHFPQSGHCVLIELGNDKVHTMRHWSDFRLAKEDEC